MDKKQSRNKTASASANKAGVDVATLGFKNMTLNSASSKSGNAKSTKGTTNDKKSHKGGSTKKLTSAPVLLGLPDSPMERNDDTDPYITKIGGVPLWLDQDRPAPSKFGLCDCCKERMYLLLQAYVPLDKSPYDRVVYVWACNQRLCMRKKGSFKVVRALKLNKEYAKKLEKKPKPSVMGTTTLPSANPFATPAAFDIGNALFGGANSGFSNPFAAPSGGIGSSNAFAPPPGFGSTPQIPSQSSSSSFASVTASSIPEREATPVETLEDETEGIDRDWTGISGFSPYYLYHAEEVFEDAVDEEIKQKYGHLLAMEDGHESDGQGVDYEDDSQGDSKGGKGGSATWGGEAYEKQALPKGVDKAFQKFTERVQLWPEQCVRYDFVPGTPMLFTYADATAQLLLPPNTKQHSYKHTKPSAHRVPRCKACGGPRGFDFQLMPNLLSLLDVTKAEYLSEQETKASQERKGAQAFDIGMEWGTVMVYSCVADCFGKAAGDEGDGSVRYFEEVALAQFED